MTVVPNHKTHLFIKPKDFEGINGKICLNFAPFVKFFISLCYMSDGYETPKSVHLAKNLPIHPSVTLALHVNFQHFSLVFIELQRRTEGAERSPKIEVRQRHTTQYLMTHYSYTYSLLLAAL